MEDIKAQERGRKEMRKAEEQQHGNIDRLININPKLVDAYVE